MPTKRALLQLTEKQRKNIDITQQQLQGETIRLLGLYSTQMDQVEQSQFLAELKLHCSALKGLAHSIKLMNQEFEGKNDALDTYATNGTLATSVSKDITTLEQLSSQVLEENQAGTNKQQVTKSPPLLIIRGSQTTGSEGEKNRLSTPPPRYTQRKGRSGSSEV